ncbi:MAG: hypothetical protein KAW12_29160 [Candidatus Aminicenantes bacterium]|nr:hypothetical protein [Candidatus Aminicenantes bacterium]
MRRIILILFLVFLVFTAFSYAEKVAVLEEIMKPGSIAVDEKQVYINEDTTIFIYSLKDYTLKKKFGKAGEGPEEFLRAVIGIIPWKDHLLINSFGKISYFTKDGIYQKELKTGVGVFNGVFRPLQEGFVGFKITREDGVGYLNVVIYDARLKAGKSIYKMKSPVQQTGKMKMLNTSLTYKTYDNKIFITGKEGFTIDVLDHTGKSLFSIEQEYKRRKFTAEDEKNLREVIKLEARGQYEAVKNRLSFPDYYPEFLDIYLDDNKLYAATWKREGDKLEFYIFDIKGKLLKRQFIPFTFQDAMRPFPFAVKSGKLYQVVENEDEDWELHISKIE